MGGILINVAKYIRLIIDLRVDEEEHRDLVEMLVSNPRLRMNNKETYNSARGIYKDPNLLAKWSRLPAENVHNRPKFTVAEIGKKSTKLIKEGRNVVEASVFRHVCFANSRERC